MIQDIETRLSERQILRGQALHGRICFSSSLPRNLTDFLVQISVEASLHTVVPTSSGIHSHTDRIAFRDTKILTNTRHQQARHFEVPFTYQIPIACPISMTYKDMAKIQWTLRTSVRDLSTGHAGASTCCTDFTVLPSRECSNSSPITRMHKKITYTASTSIVPDTKYFVQLAYPAQYNIADHRITLTKSLKISNGSSTFAKRTERPLSISKVIARTAPDASKLMVLEVMIPAGLDCSVNVVGLVRSYSITVYLAPKHKTAVNLSFDVCCDHIGHSTPAVESVAQKTSMLSTDLARSKVISPPLKIETAMSFQPRIAPTPPRGIELPGTIRAHDGSSLTAQSLKRLSMSQLATTALRSDGSGVTPAEHAPLSNVTRSSSTSSQTSLSDYGSASPVSPRSIASSISDASSRDRIAMQFSSAPTSPKTPSMENKPTERTNRHKRQTSSFSLMSKRTSDMLSFSNISRRLKPSKSFEFSCRGPAEIPPPSALMSSSKQEKPQAIPRSCKEGALEHNNMQRADHKRPSTPVKEILSSHFDAEEEDTPETPGSCYSSMPATPRLEANPFDSMSGNQSPPRTSALVARSLSFSRAFQRDQIHPKRGTSPHFSMTDKRFSMSTCYLDGFHFEGLASLDDDDNEPSHEDADSVYSLGLAAGQAL